MPSSSATATQPNPKPRRTGGSVRSKDAHAEVLAAAAELLEECGFGALTIEGVAARSGVAKSTIYRWWKSKAELIMETFNTTVTQRLRVPDTGSVKRDLTIFIRELYRISSFPWRVNALRGLMTAAQFDEAFADVFRGWIGERRAVVAQILQRGQERGEIAPDIDLEHAVDLVFGPFWYRLLVQHAPLNGSLAGGHVAQVLQGLAPQTQT
ncbi:TetR/AcrR family transcriptional regulator [Actinacidiphila acididurans]|uniref:TetR/AcrR family transcriptional regulator n=1 Tax=Actinacidiphila acididurans TaxID=2784346 RepID=A0ABS2TVU4_9ACTN|nr:TetR/AcrR family transcriptional regulator [Actinacidiphila acididurans]MBM9507468.1 TetR/AcrR family transcriptional regulator [Actinacidiphila acididurans]